jgi:hypothetical protein
LAQQDISANELKEPIVFLTSDKLTSNKNLGSYPGGKVNKKIVRYIEKDLKKHDRPPYLKSYK